MAISIPGSINGVANTSTYLHRPSQSAVAAVGTSSVHLEPTTFKAFNTSPIYKSVPVSFYANNNFIGTATFSGVTATLVTTALGTGSNTIRAEWPGEGRYAGFTKQLGYTFVVNPAYNWLGTLSISGPTSAYQLNTATITATLSSGTTVSGVLTFKEKIGNTTTVIGSVAMTGRSASIQYPVNNLGTGTLSHKIIAEWTQGRVDNVPYYPVTTNNTLTQTINTASLTLVADKLTMTIADPLTLTVSANTASINKPGIFKFINDTTVLSTATMVQGTNNVSTTLPAGTFGAGTYSLTSEYLNANPNYPSNALSLTVNDRANWPGSFTLSGQSSGYQLDNQIFVLTTDLSTATTGNVYLQEEYNGAVRNLSTATFTQQSVSFIVNPNNYGFTATNVHNFRVYWGGQTYVPNVFYPYNEKYSNTLTQTINLASITVTSNTTSTSAPKNFTATLNTTTDLNNAQMQWDAIGYRFSYDVALTTTSTNVYIQPKMYNTTTWINTSTAFGVRNAYQSAITSSTFRDPDFNFTSPIATTNWADGVDYGLTLYPPYTQNPGPVYVKWENWPTIVSQNNGPVQYWIEVPTFGTLTTPSITPPPPFAYPAMNSGVGTTGYHIWIDGYVELSQNTSVSNTTSQYYSLVSYLTNPNTGSYQSFPANWKGWLRGSHYRVVSCHEVNNKKYLLVALDGSYNDANIYKYESTNGGPSGSWWKLDAYSNRRDILSVMAFNSTATTCQLVVYTKDPLNTGYFTNNPQPSYNYYINKVTQPISTATFSGVSSIATLPSLTNEFAGTWTVQATLLGTNPVISGTYPTNLKN